MHFLLGGLGMLGLIGLAFGEAAAVRTAQVVIMLFVAFVLLVACDILTRGSISGWIMG